MLQHEEWIGAVADTISPLHFGRYFHAINAPHNTTVESRRLPPLLAPVSRQVAGSDRNGRPEVCPLHIKTSQAVRRPATASLFGFSSPFRPPGQSFNHR